MKILKITLKKPTYCNKEYYLICNSFSEAEQDANIRHGKDSWELVSIEEAFAGTKIYITIGALEVEWANNKSKSEGEEQ